MVRPNVPDVQISDSQDAERAAYRPVAWQAVLGLFFGLLAPLAMLGPAFWAIPALGCVINWKSLGRIQKSKPAPTGRKAAMWGLAFSLAFLAAGPTDWLVYRRMVRQEARQFACAWFKCLTQGEPHKAFQLTLLPQLRQPLDDRLWSYYRNAQRSRANLDAYVEAPVVRRLLALGPKAQVRFYQTTWQGRYRDTDHVEQWYAVTYEEDGERKSYFMAVRMIRSRLDDGGADWRITQVRDGVLPAGW